MPTLTAQRTTPQATEIALDRIVVGMDFSPTAIAGATWVRQFLAPTADCTLVHALHVPRLPSFLRGFFPAREQLLETARADAEARLEKVIRENEWGAVRTEVRAGRPEDVLAEAARESGADLVVAGEHMRPRFFASIGSTAEALVRTAPVPVLLARGVADHPPRRILVAVDESEHALAALRWARVFARRYAASVTAFHAFRPVYVAVATAVSGMQASRTLEEEQLSQAHAWLEKCVHAAGFGHGEADVQTESGEAATSLIAAQQGGDYDLVIIGSRGAGGAGRMLLGSVANAVLHAASCAVLVVRLKH